MGNPIKNVPFDPANTTTWQRVDNAVYLLEEIDGKWTGKGADTRPETRNKFSITVYSHGRTDTTEECKLAQQICDDLNAKLDR